MNEHAICDFSTKLITTEESEPVMKPPDQRIYPIPEKLSRNMHARTLPAVEGNLDHRPRKENPGSCSGASHGLDQKDGRPERGLKTAKPCHDVM